MQIPGYFEDMNYLHVNTEPDRAYYIPASGKGCYFLDREKSDRFLLLSGSWQFQYFESVYDLPEGEDDRVEKTDVELLTERVEDRADQQ